MTDGTTRARITVASRAIAKAMPIPIDLITTSSVAGAPSNDPARPAL